MRLLIKLGHCRFLLLGWCALGAGVYAAAATEIIDKTVAAVGEFAITASEVDQQVALESFSEGKSAEYSDPNRQEALERVIRQRLVAQEMAVANFAGVGERDVLAQLEHQKQLFGGAKRFRESLGRYGLTEQEVAEFLRRQLDFERFIDFRFKTGLVPPRNDVVAYYKEVYLPALERINRTETLDEAYPVIEQTLIEQRINPLLENWILEVRARTRIEILDAALKPTEN